MTTIALLLALSTAPPASPSPAAAGPTARLQDLAFLVGRWRETTANGFSEETWSSAEGDSMVGMWRLVSGDKARIFEILTLTQEEGGVVMRIRHFDPRLVAREDKDAPLTMPLARATKDEAVFESASSNRLPRVTYRRAKDELAVSVEREGGAPLQFTFRRAGNP